MLQQVCENICNYFIRNRYEGRFEISGGMVSLPLLEGQRFLIQGSAMNDGIYTYHDSGIRNDDDTVAVGLHDETFTGAMCALAVPPTLIALSGEINSWVEEHGEAVNSPSTSENVLGVYSYSKQTGGTGAGGTVGWQDIFASQLKRWRKVNFG